MNGNQLADILKYSGGNWRAGQVLPREWWKTNFPYREAERMGYKMSPGEITQKYGSPGQAEKSVSNQIADILKSRDFMMLDPKGRAEVIKLAQEIKVAEAEEARARETHEAEMMAKGRETQLQTKIQDILQSNRVPAQKVTALTMAGVPLSDARDMVWGKGAPEEAVGKKGVETKAPEDILKTRRTLGYVLAAKAGKYSSAELTAALMGEGMTSEAAKTIAEQIPAAPERPRGVRVFEEGGRLITAPVVAPPTAAEEARLGVEAERGELHRKYLYALEDARKKEVAAQAEKTRGNILKAMTDEAEQARLEAEARRLMLLEVDARGRELTAQKKAEEKERLQAQKEYWENKRNAIKDAITTEAEKEKEKAAAREDRIRHLDSLYEKTKTAKEEKEQARLEKEEEKWKETRKAIKEATEKDDETRRNEEEAERERDKEARELGEELADKRYKLKMEKIKYDDEKKKIDREYQDKKDKELRDYKVTILEKTFNWMKLFDGMGFDNKDLIEIVPQFLRTLDVNKKDEADLMSAFDVMGKVAALNEEEVVTEYERLLKEQYSSIDRQITTEGLTEEIENQVEMSAFLQFALDDKRLGHEQAIEKWKNILKTGGWYFGPAEIPFKSVKAKSVFREKMKEVIEEAKAADIIEVAGKVVGKQNQKKLEELVKESKKKKGAEVLLPEALETAITGLNDSDSNQIIDSYKSILDTKAGAITYEPATTDREKCIAWACGVRNEGRERKDLPVNLTPGEYLIALLKEPRLTQKMRGWLIWKRFTPVLWEGMQNEAGILGHLVMSKAEETQPDGILDKIGSMTKGLLKIGEKITGWYKWGKEEKKETEIKESKPEGKRYFWQPKEKELREVGRDIKEDLREIVKTHPGIKGKEAAMYLKEMGWSDDDIRALGGGR